MAEISTETCGSSLFCPGPVQEGYCLYKYLFSSVSSQASIRRILYAYNQIVMDHFYPCRVESRIRSRFPGSPVFH